MIPLEDLYHGSYVGFHECERAQRNGPNTKTEKRVHGYNTDLATFYWSVCRWGDKRACCSSPGVEHNAIWSAVRECMVVEIQ